MLIFTRRYTQLSFPPWELQTEWIYPNQPSTNQNQSAFISMKKAALLVLFTGISAILATPSLAGSEPNMSASAPVDISTEIPTSTPSPSQVGAPLQANNTLNSAAALSAANAYQNPNTSNCSGQLCIQGGVTNTPGAGMGTSLGFSWSPNPISEQLKKNEELRARLVMLEARRQVADLLATALEQKQYERARILAIQLVGPKNYRNYLRAITAGSFPNP